MWLKYLSISLLFFTICCVNNTDGSNAPITENILAENNEQDTTEFWEKLVMVEFKDANGVVTSIMPFPATWKIGQPNSSNGGVSITGPKGVKVTDYQVRSFMFNSDPSIQQAYAQVGQPMRPMPGVDQLIQEDFVPWGQSEGMQLLDYYEISEISKVDKWYTDQLFKAMPSQMDVVALGLDWKKKDGSKYFLIVHLNVSTTYTDQFWYYMATGMSSNADYYDRAKKQLIFALANTRYNLEPIMKYNREEAQRVGQSWAAFNQRMAQNQANFDASQRAYVNSTEAINNAMMSSYKSSNEASDRMQEQAIDGIYEETNVQNTGTGQQYKVSAGANNYWMNSNGEYISNSQSGYNPNLDQNMNGENWQELKEIKR